VKAFIKILSQCNDIVKVPGTTLWWQIYAGKLRKSDSFIMSVRPSAWNNSAPTGRIFVKFDIWRFFETMSR
jgi:hypothetical protein